MKYVLSIIMQFDMHMHNCIMQFFGSTEILLKHDDATESKLCCYFIFKTFIFK